MSNEAESGRLGPDRNPPPILLQGAWGMQWTASLLLFLRTIGTLIQSAPMSVSLLFLTWSHPAQAITEDTALPCVHASEQRRVAEQLNLWNLWTWFLLKAASPSQLRGLSKGYFPLLSLLKWTFRWFPSRKNLSLKDTAQIWDTAIWGHPQAEGNKGQKRLWDRKGQTSPWGGEAVAGPALGRAGAETVRSPEQRKALTSWGPQQNQQSPLTHSSCFQDTSWSDLLQTENCILYEGTQVHIRDV